MEKRAGLWTATSERGFLDRKRNVFLPTCKIRFNVSIFFRQGYVSKHPTQPNATSFFFARTLLNVREIHLSILRTFYSLCCEQLLANCSTYDASYNTVLVIKQAPASHINNREHHKHMYTYGRKQRIDIRCVYKGEQLLSISNNNFFFSLFLTYCIVKINDFTFCYILLKSID